MPCAGPGEFGHHIGRRAPVVRERNHGVKPQIGHFVDELLHVTTMITIFGRHHRLGGFFANFLEKGIRPFVEQARDIAFLRISTILGFSAFDHSGQTGQIILG